MNVAEALARGLQRHGVKVIFSQCFPMQTQHVLPRYGVRQIGFRTENAGGTMADGYARISHQIGVVAAQSGPGATLLVPPLAEALTASIPILAIVEESARSQADRNAFQEFDHLKLFDGCAKWIRRIDRADRIDDYLDMAMVMATTGRPGPVVLLLPFDLMGESAIPSTRQQRLGHYPLDRVLPERRLIEEASRMISFAKRPVIVAGGGVHLSDAAAELVALSELGGIPVATTNMGKGVIDERSPLALGVFGNCMGPGAPSHELRGIASEADLVILVGSRTNSNGTDNWSLFPKDAQFIQIDVDGLEIGRNYEAFRLVGDARATLAAIVAELGDGHAIAGRGRHDTLVAAIAASRAASEIHLDTVGKGQQGAVRPEHMIRVLDGVLRENDIVVADASFSTSWVSSFLRARSTGARFLEPRGLAGLGWGFPLAMGAKLARPEANVFAVVGDGGFAHCWSELETARRLGINVVTIVLNNQILGFQLHAEELFFRTHSDAAELGPVDHAAIARACGCHGERVASPDEMLPALSRAMNAAMPAVLDLITDVSARPPLGMFSAIANLE